MSIYDEIPARPEPQRDRYGRYLIDGKPRTRVTTFAGAIADKASLIPWAQARAVRGVVERPDLLAAAAAAMDDERALRKVCEEAKEVGGATAAATLGTALHRMTELADLGLPTPELHADRVGEYRACLAAHRVEILPDWVETVLLVDRFDLAGTCDRIVMWDGRPTILDLKTGKSLDFGLGEYSIQLALYAHGDHAWDVAKGERLELPEIRRDVALIAHLPAQGTGCELVAVDIEAGWAAAELAEGVRAWRKRRDLGRKIVAGAGEQPPTPDGTSGAVVEAVETPAPARADAELAARTEWLLGRIRALPHAGREALAVLWPDGVPKGANVSRTAAQLDLLAQAVDAAEDAVEAPFAPPDPTIPAAPQRDRTPPAPPPAEAVELPPAEDRPLTDDEAAKLIGRVRNCPSLQQLRAWAAEADRHGVLLGIPDAQRTLHHGNRLGAALMCAPHGDELTRLLIHAVTGAEPQPVEATGALLATLDTRHASALYHAARSIAEGYSALTFADDGTPVVAPIAA